MGKINKSFSRKFVEKSDIEKIVKTWGDKNMTEEKEPALSSEVSEKIRAAISAKLKELGAYVDDELPDYIMVLVANKKNQAQMKEDLQLFLHQHADVFTAWLGDILNKLKDVTKKPKPAYTIGNNIKETKISATKKKGEKGEKKKKKKKNFSNKKKRGKREKKKKKKKKKS